MLAFLLYLEAGSSVAHWALAAACPQLSKSSLISLSDGQMKARLLSMQRTVQFVLQLKNDKEIFTWLVRNFFTLSWIKSYPPTIFFFKLIVIHSTVWNLLILKYQVFFPSNKIFLVSDRLDVGAGWGSVKIYIS